MAKPSKFKYVQDPTISQVGVWGERTMALVIAVTIIAVRSTTTLPTIVGFPYWIEGTLNGVAVVYVAALATILAKPTQFAHQIGMIAGVYLFSMRATALTQLWNFPERVGGPFFGNIAERWMLVATVVVYHLWGIWTDRREIEPTP